LACHQILVLIRLAMTDRPQKITFAEMRDMGIRGLLIYWADGGSSQRPRDAVLFQTPPRLPSNSPIRRTAF
jgi:hypothetical protein